MGPEPDCSESENWDDEVSSGAETDVWMVRVCARRAELGRTSTPSDIARPELANHSAASRHATTTTAKCW